MINTAISSDELFLEAVWMCMTSLLKQLAIKDFHERFIFQFRILNERKCANLQSWYEKLLQCVEGTRVIAVLPNRVHLSGDPQWIKEHRRTPIESKEAEKETDIPNL